MKKKLRENWSCLLIGLFFVITLIYILIKKDNIYLQTHDYLDSNIVWIKMLKDNNIFWEKFATVPFLGGIDRNYLYSELKAYMWIFMIFPTFPAIIIGWYLKIIMATVGFNYLGKSIGNEFYKKNRMLLIWCGFLYGILPTYPPLAFAFSSLPLLIGSLIRCYRKFQWKYLAILFLYPLLSDFTTFGIFICGYILVYFMIDWIVRKKKCVQLMGCLVALVIGYIITEWRLFEVMFFSSEETIRSTMSIEYMDFVSALKESMKILIKGYYHCGSLHTYVVLPICTIYTIKINALYIKNREWKKLYNDVVNWLWGWIIFNSIVYGLDSVKIFKEIISVVIPPLKGFSFARTVWFNPFLWYLLFFIVLTRIHRKKVVYCSAILAGLVVCAGPETYNHMFFNCLDIVCDIVGEENVEKLVGRELELLSYKEFYSEDLFENIKEDIDYSGEWSIAFGMHPAVLEYNGISTLDGYLSYYSQSYKDKFRELIEPELEIDEENRKYFDSWGGRAYIYSNEISYNPAKVMSKEEANMNIDTNVFKEMNGKYVFSLVKIHNADELGLEIVNVYLNKKSPYKIFLYTIQE